MSSVCTTADPGTASRSRPAKVVFPLELRPSTASATGRSPASITGRSPAGATGRSPTPRSRPSRITTLATSLTSSARHGPASGSSGASRIPTVGSPSLTQTALFRPPRPASHPPATARVSPERLWQGRRAHADPGPERPSGPRAFIRI
jgi:hypothetical protein